jgi:hypothetical protein
MRTELVVSGNQTYQKKYKRDQQHEGRKREKAPRHHAHHLVCILPSFARAVRVTFLPSNPNGADERSTPSGEERQAAR